ncbi:MAG: ABC transporter permease [Chloroflexi bacterium]|nr:MAG: ABC transporter permease [Chloroflexota bacterium]
MAVANQTRPGRAASRTRWARRETLVFYLCISPWLIGFFLWTAGPMVYSAWLSLNRWDLFTAPVWVGLENYQRMFQADPDFWQSLKVTTIYSVVSVPLHLAGAFAVALLMNQTVGGINYFRTIYYLPAILPGVAVAVLWIWVFNPQFGILNMILHWFGIEGPNWLGDPQWALPALILMSLWSIGGGMIIYLAGLKGIPRPLYEAAEIDGAGTIRKFWNITVPQMTPTIFFNLIMGIIGSFQTFTAAYVMTNGGPRKATFFYYFYLYQMAFQNFRMGYAAAMAWILFIIILVLTLLVFRSQSLWVYYESERK